MNSDEVLIQHRFDKRDIACCVGDAVADIEVNHVIGVVNIIKMIVDLLGAQGSRGQLCFHNHNGKRIRHQDIGTIFDFYANGKVGIAFNGLVDRYTKNISVDIFSDLQNKPDIRV